MKIPSLASTPAVEVLNIWRRAGLRWRNSVHITHGLWIRCVFLRAVSFAPDEGENV